MKKFPTFIKTALLAAMAVVMVACGKTGGGDYRNLIPEDAFMTMSLNPQSILDKAGLSDAERAAVKGQAEMAMTFMGGMLSADDKKFILSIIDNFDNSGVSFKNNIYLSIAGDFSAGDMEDARVAAIGKISDSKKFGKLIDLIKKLDPSIEVRSDRGLNIIIVEESGDNTVVVAYNDNAVVLFVHSGDYPATIAQVSEIFKGTNSLASNKEYDKFTNAKSDLSILMNYEPIMEMVKQQMPMGFPYMDMFTHARIYSNTNFEKGKIDTDMGVIFTDKDAQKEFEDLYSKAKINGKFSKYLSDNAIFAAAGYFDGSKTYDILTKIPQTAMIGFFPEAKKIIEAFDGEVFVSLSWLDEVSGILLATVTDNTILQTLMDQFGEYTDIIRYDGKYYAVDYEGVTVSFGIKDDVLFIGNDAEMIAALDGNSVNNPDKDVVSMFSKGYGAFYVSFDNLSDAIVSNFRGYMDSDTAMALELLDLFKDLQVTADSPQQAKLVINMEDQSKNAMASIADKIRSIIMANMF